MIVRTKKLNENAIVPVCMTKQSAGSDLYACLDKSVIISGGGGVVLIPTGIAIKLPEGYEGQIRPRSGLAAKYGVTVLNAPGTVDSDFLGQIQVLLINHGKNDFVVEHGMRVAQIIVARHESPEFDIVDQLGETDRNTGGFGSTGLK